jgi:signal transduction histidine kinase/ActR/RegA family two-component response regulator
MKDLSALVAQLQKQQDAIVRLARKQGLNVDLQDALSHAVVESAETLQVERVGVWLLSEDRQELRCVRSFTLSTRTLGGGEVLHSVDYPAYFAALESGRGIEAHDARQDPRTNEFRDGYLVPLGITSMLDATIRDEGRVIGVVCHEHIGPARIWTPDVLGFAGAVADQVSMALANAERHRLAAERDEMQKHMLHSQKLESLGLLAGGIAHDFNNLLVGILTNAEFSRDVLDPGHPAHPALDDVVAAAERTALLTRQLLTFSGRSPTIFKPADLVHHVKELAHLLEASISKKVQVVLDLPAEAPNIRADESQLQQVIMNVILNAAEAIGKESGSVRVTVRAVELSENQLRTLVARSARPGPHVLFEVADTGRGIDEASLARIFDPFFTTKGSGRGLGLAAVVGIMASHEGALGVTSTPGRGTTFRLYFPVAGSNLPGEVEKTIRRTDARGTILVIDDESLIRKVLQRVLLRAGYEVLQADSGRAGVEILRASGDQIRCVILDVTMPELSGIETLPELRRVRSGLPVLFMSGFDHTDSLKNVLRNEQVHFLAKPFSPDGLLEKIDETLCRDGRIPHEFHRQCR